MHTAPAAYFTEFLNVSLDEYAYWGWLDTDVILGKTSPSSFSRRCTWPARQPVMMC